MQYYIGGKNQLLNTGDALFINSKEIHYGYSRHNADCEFVCLLFHPSLFSSNQTLFHRFITPFLASQIPYILLSPKNDAATISCIAQIYEKKLLQNTFYEFEIIGLLYTFMTQILRISKTRSVLPSSFQPDSALRTMISFIHENYQDAICLNDIAASAGLCKSKCCQLFSSQLQMTPFYFLNHFRLGKSAELLQQSSLPVTTIALNCGFNSPSYFSKLFSRIYHCTPREYRKSHTGSSRPIL